MGLGSLKSVSLAKARDKARDARSLVADGLDPIAERKAAAEVPTFGELADEQVKLRTAGLRNEKSKYRWKRALEVHAADLRPLKVNAVTTAAVVAVLQPIWLKTPDAASKVRGYVEAVLDAARAKGHRSGENPARWRGHLDQLLTKQPKLVRGHHAALTYQDVPAFTAELRTREGVAALALEFTILTAARSGEVVGARWSEIDLAAKVWTVPAARMKGGLEHRVPLSGRASEILTKTAELRTATGDVVVFPGASKTGSLSNMAFAMLLRRMKRGDLTTHGFRSSFRDWCGEATAFPREVAEAALAHVVGDSAERAYRRGDALEKRRKLMEAWAGFCQPKGGNIAQFAKRGGA